MAFQNPALFSIPASGCTHTALISSLLHFQLQSPLLNPELGSSYIFSSPPCSQSPSPFTFPNCHFQFSSFFACLSVLPPGPQCPDSQGLFLLLRQVPVNVSDSHRRSHSELRTALGRQGQATDPGILEIRLRPWPPECPAPSKAASCSSVGLKVTPAALTSRREEPCQVARATPAIYDIRA